MGIDTGHGAAGRKVVIVRDGPGGALAGQIACGCEPAAVACDFVAPDKAFQRVEGGFAVGGGEDFTSSAVEDALANVLIVILLRGGLSDGEVARLVKIGRGQRQSRRKAAGGDRVADGQIARLNVDEFAELAALVPDLQQGVGELADLRFPFVRYGFAP